MFKFAIGGSIVGLSFFSIYKISTIKESYNTRLEYFYKKKNDLLNSGKIQFLYSSLTLYYILNINKNKIEDFPLYYELISFAKPKYISIKLSEDDYSKKYEKYARSKTFMKDLSRIEYFLKIGEIDNIKLKDYSVEEIYDLYTFYHCNRNKCKVIFSEVEESELLAKKKDLEDLSKIINKAKSNESISNLLKSSVNDQADDYKTVDEYRNKILVEKIMDDLNPKNSIFKKPTENTIVSMVDPIDYSIIPKVWKNKFKTIYNHTIIDYKDNIDPEEEKKIFKEQMLQKKGLN